MDFIPFSQRIWHIAMQSRDSFLNSFSSSRYRYIETATTTVKVKPAAARKDSQNTDM